MMLDQYTSDNRAISSAVQLCITPGKE
jgi:hypothetical protein